MNPLPIFLKLDGCRCVVIGAGTAAEPRIVGLVDAGAVVTVVAPSVTTAVGDLIAAGTILHLPRRYQRGDLEGARLAYAAVEDDAVHAEIASDARLGGIWLNVVDRTEWCDFITPALVQQGALQIAVSTNGASPALARKLRISLQREYGPEWGTALEILRRLRTVARERGFDFTAKQAAFGRLVDGPFVDYVKQGRWRDVDALLECFGEGVSLASLGMEGFGADDE